MNWTPLAPIDVEPHFPRSLTAALGKINAEIAQIVGLREFHDQRVAELDQLDPAGGDDDIFLGDDVRTGLFGLLAQEVRLRRRLPALYEEIHKSHLAAADSANSAYAAKQADVRARLESIGYVSADRFEQTAGKIEPGWIEAHPEVVAARDRLKELQAAARDDAAARANVQSLRLVEARLIDLRKRAAAIA